MPPRNREAPAIAGTLVYKFTANQPTFPNGNLDPQLGSSTPEPWCSRMFADKVNRPVPTAGWLEWETPTWRRMRRPISALTTISFWERGPRAASSPTGCRLTPRNKVLLLEAGGHDRWIWFHIPVGYLFAIGNPRADWMFVTGEEDGLGGRSLAYPRGKVIGGSSAINAMIYMRGQAADYDGWRQMGLPGWGWDDVLPCFLKHEDNAHPPSAFHRQGGEWRVENPRIRWEILDAVRSAAAAVGIAPIDDFNTGDNEGSAYFQVNQKRGRRWSAARGFLKPVLKRTNLRLQTNALVDRIEIVDGRAESVVFSTGGKQFRAGARGEVIVAAGSVASPTILERSGIGAGDHLRGLGIPVVHHAPGVGRESAGPSSNSPSLQGRGRADAEHGLCESVSAHDNGIGLPVPAARRADDGAVAGRDLRSLFKRIRNRESRIPYSAPFRWTVGARGCIRSGHSPRVSAIYAHRAGEACMRYRQIRTLRRRSGRIICPRRRIAKLRSTVSG